jgi:hypothetical protein
VVAVAVIVLSAAEGEAGLAGHPRAPDVTFTGGLAVHIES